MSALSIAVVGAGPSGFYMADALKRKLPDCRIDILERLPAPFGLVRYGVAPDHYSTKAVQRVFEKTAEKEGVRFLGNVQVGDDITYDELKATYDVVVLAIGAERDRTLGIPGEDLPGVYGSTAFVGWYNGHPDYVDLDPLLDREGVAVIGNGNVAVDCARIIARTPEELAATDISDRAAERLARTPVRDIYLFGRRGPLQAAFAPKEIGELGEMARAVPLVDPAQLPESADGGDDKEARAHARNLEILRGYAANRPEDKPVRIHIRFFSSPVEVLGRDRVEGLRLARTRLEEGRAVPTGETFEVAVGTVITAIGYRTVPFPGVPFDEKRGIIANTDGLVEPGVYVVGWCRRGPTGTIGTNRTDAMDMADRIVAECPREGGKPGPAGLDRLLAERRTLPVTFADWRKIDEAEVARAAPGAPRRKILRVEEMLEIARS